MPIKQQAVPQASQVRKKFAIRCDPIGYCETRGLAIGHDCSLFGSNSGAFGSEADRFALSNNVRVTSGVRFATNDGGAWTLRGEHPNVEVSGKIAIGHNVSIRINAAVITGVSIGDKVVAGAHSTVTEDFPSNTVAAVSPAQILSSIYSYTERSLKKATETRHLNPDKTGLYLTECNDQIHNVAEQEWHITIAEIARPR